MHDHEAEVNETLNEAISEYLRMVDNGEEPSTSDLMSRYPSVSRELEAFITKNSRVDHVLDLIGAAPPPEESLESFASFLGTGHKLGKFEIIAELARGSKALIYLVRDTQLGREVALKVFNPLLPQSDLNRIQVEAQAAASLDHRNVVTVYEVGEYNGFQTISMQFIAGGDLQQKMNSYIGDPLKIANLLESVARGVEHAHSRGILHRDIKPANILLDQRGRPHVADFGLARFIDQDRGATGSQSAVGTPIYMSPEQAQGAKEEIGAPTDVYSLGVILYELLTGDVPIKGRTNIEVIHRVVNEEPQSPSRLNPSVPRDLETICLKCLEKKPSLRYSSALELAEDLNRFQNRKPIHAKRATPLDKTVKWVQRSPTLAALLIVIIFALLGFTVLSWLHARNLTIIVEELRHFEYANDIKQVQSFLDRRKIEEAKQVLEIAGIEEDHLRGFEYYYFKDFTQGYDFEFPDEPHTFLIHSKDHLNQIEDHQLISLFQNDTLRTRSSKPPYSVLKDQKLSQKYQHLAVGRNGKTIFAWSDLAEGHILNNDGSLNFSIQLSQIIKRATVSPDSKWLALILGDDFSKPMSFKVYSTEKKEVVLEGDFEKRGRKPTELIFSKDGKSLIVVFIHSSNLFETYHVGSWERLNKSYGEGYTLVTHAISFAEDADTYYCAGYSGIPNIPGIGPVLVQSSLKDPEVKNLIIQSPERTARLQQLTCVASSPDGKTVLAGSDQGDLLVWKLGYPERVREIRAHQGWVKSLKFIDDSNRFMTTGEDGATRIWNLDSTVGFLPRKVPGEMLVSLEVNDEHKKLITTSWTSELAVRSFPPSDPNEVRPVDVKKLCEDEVPDFLYLQPGGERVAAIQENGDLRIFKIDVSSPELSLLLEGFIPKEKDERLSGAGFSSDGQHFVISFHNNLLSHYSRDEKGQWKVVNEVLRKQRFQHIMFSPNLEYLVLGSGLTSGIFVIKNPCHSETDWNQMKVLDKDGKISVITITPNSRWLICGTVEGVISLWDLESHDFLLDFNAHESPVNALTFSPDSERLVSSSKDGEIKIWDIGTDRGQNIAIEIASWKKHSKYIEVLRFTSDGCTLFSVGGDKTNYGELGVWAGRKPVVE